ncbi:hypothetical protein [Tessaracoccus coleopterorum]|uniref:hypothetical protein n=1 Tax=Tessaracoccus coleopterorum TaxID=2714950 RepID=UPI002F90DF6E
MGKTTIASVVSQATQRRFVELSAVTAGVKEVRAEIEEARRQLARGAPRSSSSMRCTASRRRSRTCCSLPWRTGWSP